ncbi:MAG TPA: AAA family ATPase [Candidatus Paceibacterota bacterium]|nr:AAA family ATPase [Candidatus Paceibacterota bacterium]
MKIYVTGVAGSGKSSIVRALAARGVTAIDMDQGLCHWENRHTGGMAGWEPGRSEEWYAEHGWMCDVPELSSLLAIHDDIVVVGISSNQEEYMKFFDKVFVLHSKPETIIARINARTDSEYGKHPAEQKRLLAWQKSFEEEMAAKGAIPLDGERPIEEVVEDIVKELQ